MRSLAPAAKTTKSSHTEPKTLVLRTPQPVQDRVIARHIAGQSNRMIAADEGIDRSTVGRILSQREAADLMAEYQSRILLSLVPKAIAAFEEILDSDDPHLKAATATKVLEGIGALQKVPVQRLPDDPADAQERERKHQRLLLYGQMTELMLTKAGKFGTTLPPGFADLADAESLTVPPSMGTNTST